MRYFAVLILACVAACNAQEPLAAVPRDGESYVPGDAWRTAAPAQVGLDPGPVDDLLQRIGGGEIRDLHSLVIVRHGYLVVERYFNGSGRLDVHTMQSVSKSVTSLLVGIAVGDGRLRTADPVLPLFSYPSLVNADARKRGVTVRDLLTMRSGIDFFENPYAGSPLQILNESQGDWTQYILERPMNDVPNGHWQYNSGGAILLASVLRAATGVDPVDYARERLFTPLGIGSARWFRSPFDGLPHTGGGLSLRAPDLARVGYLVLRRGRWGDRRIVSEGWIAESMTRVTRNTAGFGGHPQDYGYLWWLMTLPGGSPDNPDDAIYMASGNMNQWLFVVPRHDLVVVVTGASNASFGAPVAFLFDDILPAIVE